jgi:hypothetical protein
MVKKGKGSIYTMLREP